MLFSYNQDAPFLFTRDVPATLHRYLVPGSLTYATTNEHTYLLIQELPAEGCRIFHAVFRADGNHNLHVQDETPCLFIYLSLQQDRHLEIEGLGPLFLKEGQYNMFYVSRLDAINVCQDSREYLTLVIQYERAVLDEWAGYFPVLAAFLEKAAAGGAAALLDQPAWFTREIQDTLYRIKNGDLAAPSHRLCFNLLVKTLLFHLLLQAVQRQPVSPYTHYEIGCIQAARKMIRTNIRYHFTIREVAQKVGMNEFKLKNGFRELFGNGVYEYLRTERMEEARQLLTNSDKSVKQVAALTGYKSVNSFIKAFKKKFGQTPGGFKRQLPSG